MKTLTTYTVPATVDGAYDPAAMTAEERAEELRALRRERRRHLEEIDALSRAIRALMNPR